MDNYHYRYLKYKHKYLNLLTKTKRIRENMNSMPNDTDGIINNLKKLKISNKPNLSRDSILAGLFNMFVSESVYELNPNYLFDNIDESDNINIKKNKNNQPTHEYNFRNIKYIPKRETEDFIIGSYTPEIIKNLQSNGISSEIIDELVEKFNSDDKANLDSLIEQNEQYINFDNNGKIIECWVADNMHCPCCGEKSLRRYVKDNMPCIDLICSNPSHKFVDGVKFFQVKAKSSEVINEQYKNFNYTTKTIRTGSKTLGFHIHSIETINDYYTLLFGYICIEYKKKINNLNEIINILPSSFIVLPKIYINESKVLFSSPRVKQYNNKLGLVKEISTISDTNHSLYYWYKDNDKQNIIEFSTSNNDIIFFNDSNKIILFDSNLSMNFITTDYNPNLPSKWIIIPNPFNKNLHSTIQLDIASRELLQVT